MTDATSGSQTPITNGLEKHQRSPSTGHAQQFKRNNRNKRVNTQAHSYLDGTVSDSVTNAVVSPRSKKSPHKQRQSVSGATAPQPNGYGATTNNHRTGPVSVAGPMRPATPAKEQAYAGPTFHASPAPSSLPMPKFISRSVPNALGQVSLRARMNGDKTPEKEESSPEPDVVSPVNMDAHQSPLDLFFKADREEKEKRRQASLAAPEMISRGLPAAQRQNTGNEWCKSVFLGELDGHVEDRAYLQTLSPDCRAPIERAHSTPNKMTPPESNQDEQRDTPTKSLKDLLFNNIASAPQRTTTPPGAHSAAPTDANMFNTPSPFQRPSSGPSTPTPSSDQQNYALHYGNRNLSPLFKAARADTPTRPSGLRQELSNENSHIPPRHLPQLDPNTFSREYLHQQLRDHPSTGLLQSPLVNAASSRGVEAAPMSSSSFSGPSTVQQGVMPDLSGSSSAHPRSGGESRDIRSMEDGLRRMLNLNVSE
ncbi:hypothetical protein M433DRAFT_416340 [Acidomyces richmondensis BFW]|nr:MAG: hypothetical protein FE78DRAFT_27050 [Acidomyces sp. 'richmondensis']KYG48455.1 hypothetical protein M433DRAFT_416340 [Acidomyces richmondensis BFW]